jgi:tetratricopeptide (TPR) repeat protein
VRVPLTILFTFLVFHTISTAGPADDAYDQAKSLMEQGNLKEAASLAVSGLATEPDHFKLNRLTGDIYFKLGQYQDALGFYERALEKKSKDPDALFGAGMSSYESTDFEKAESYFERGVDTGKKKGAFLYGLGIAQMEMGNFTEADLNMRKAIEKDKDNPLYHLALAEINFRNKVYSISILEFDRAVELDTTLESSVYDLHYKKAQAQLQMRNVVKAIEEYRQHLDLHPGDTTAWLDMANICNLSDKYSEAAFCYERYLEIVPDNGDIWFDLGILYHTKLRDNQKALMAFEKAVELKSHEAEAFGYLAKIYADIEEYEKAIDAYNRYEATFGPPDSVLYWFDRGKVEIKLGVKNIPYFDSALVSFRKAIDLDSSFSAAYEYAGLSEYYKRDYSAAVPYLKKKIEMDSTSVNAYRNLAFCYLKLESYSLAAETFKKALALKPDDVQMRSMLGKIYTFNKNYENSVRQYEILLNEYSELLNDSLRCMIYPDLGLSYLSLLKCQQAIPVLLKAERCHPRDTAVLLNIASSYQTCNQIKEARTYYEKVLELDPNNKVALRGKLETTIQGQE